MSIIYTKYMNSTDHTWYKSSNILYSECKDDNSEYKPLKITFKNGRTYKYNAVTVEDYIYFKMHESQGKAFNERIKKYEAVRLPDIDPEELNKKMEQMIADSKELEEINSNIVYQIQKNEETGEFKLLLNDKVIFEGIENQVSIQKLFASMKIQYTVSDIETLKAE